jgi:hypothetical protein
MIISKYVSSKWLLVHLAVALSVIIEGGLFRAQADEDAGDLFNYSFAVWVGSGVYKISDANKRFAVLRVPAAYTFRPAQYDKFAFLDKLGFRLLLPAVIAFEEETETNFQFGAGAFVPGLEVQVPVNKYWTLKPIGQFGAGKDTAGGDLRYIYGGGARSLIGFSWENPNVAKAGGLQSQGVKGEVVVYGKIAPILGIHKRGYPENFASNIISQIITNH